MEGGWGGWPGVQTESERLLFRSALRRLSAN